MARSIASRPITRPTTRIARRSSSIVRPTVSSVSRTAIPLAVDRLLHGGVVDRTRLVGLMSANPARILSLPGGTLAVGAPADVTVLDLERPVLIDPSAFASLSRNCPFGSWKLRGGPVMTIVGGEIVWRAAAAG